MPPKKAPRHVREGAAAVLWKSSSAADWKAALAAAPGRARSTGVHEDQAFYALQPALAARAGGAHPVAGLRKEDLVTAVAWKIKRGTFRPLLRFAHAATGAQVGAVASAAATALGRASPPPLDAVSAAVAALSELKGVGPATATALLSAADPSIPFLSDEASAVVLGAREYSAPAAAALTVALRKRASVLGEGWNARDVERALWSASRGPEVDGAGGGGDGGGGGGGGEGGGAAAGGKKRKR